MSTVRLEALQLRRTLTKTSSPTELLRITVNQKKLAVEVEL